MSSYSNWQIPFIELVFASSISIAFYFINEKELAILFSIFGLFTAIILFIIPIKINQIIEDKIKNILEDRPFFRFLENINATKDSEIIKLKDKYLEECQYILNKISNGEIPCSQGVYYSNLIKDMKKYMSKRISNKMVYASSYIDKLNWIKKPGLIEFKKMNYKAFHGGIHIRRVFITTPNLANNKEFIEIIKEMHENRVEVRIVYEEDLIKLGKAGEIFDFVIFGNDEMHREEEGTFNVFGFKIHDIDTIEMYKTHFDDYWVNSLKYEEFINNIS